MPYYSTKRPNARELYGGQYWNSTWWWFGHWTGPRETDLDHNQIKTGSHVWSSIKHLIPNRKSLDFNNTKEVKAQFISESYFPNQFINSTTNILVSDGKPIEFLVEDAKDFKVIASVSGNQKKDNFKIRDPNGKLLDMTSSTAEHPYDDKRGQNHYEVIVQNPIQGTYYVKAPKKSSVYIDITDGEEVRLDTGLSSSKMVYEVGDTPNFTVNTTANKQQTQVFGTITHTARLDASEVEDIEPIPIDFEKIDDTNFSIKAQPFLKSGIYDITLKVKGETYEKTLQTTVSVIGDDITQNELQYNELKIDELKVYPNPFKTTINIFYSNPQSIVSDIEIYDMFGRLVDVIKIKDKSQNIASYQFENPKSQMYIVSFETTKGRRSATVIRE